MSVKCWFCNVEKLSDPSLFSQGMDLLPWAERKEQVIRYRFEKDRKLCLGAGLLLLFALRNAGVTDLNLCRLKNGKPALVSCSNIHFNLSHSGTFAVCAVSDRPVGADVETIQNADPKVAAVCFQQHEQEWIFQADDPGRAFTCLWTRKESYLKRTGTGLYVAPDSFSVLPWEQMTDGSVFTECEVENHLICVSAERETEVEFCEWPLDISFLAH